ncbi:hypothetical protein BH10PSE5_BH10PSE5_14690 [soil metagenome]
MTIARTAATAALIAALGVSQSGCIAMAAGAVVGTAVGVTASAVGLTAKGVGMAGRAIIPGDSRDDRDQDRKRR